MIRVNFMNATSSNASLLRDENLYLGTPSAPNDAQVFIKLLVIFLFPGVLIFFEHQNLSSLRAQIKASSRELSSIQQELTANADVAQVLKQLNSEKKRLEDQMEVIRKLNKNRLRTIKALDKLQSLTPDNLWFQTVQFDGSKCQMSGLASSSDDISLLIKRMEESVIFSEVVLTSSTEQQSEHGTFKKFDLGCSLGDQ